MTVVDVRQHRADYGFDGDYRRVSAPTAAKIVGAVSAGLLAYAARCLVRGKPVAAAVAGGTGAFIVTTAALFIRTTRIGKFEVWAEILDGLRLRGDERLLDLGCGRGAVLLAAAKRWTTGHGFGVDSGSRGDQSGNSVAATRRNAEAEGVSQRVAPLTANMMALPFPSDTFDVVVSNIAIH